MWVNTTFCILVIFSIIGISEVVRKIIFYLLKDKSDLKHAVVVPIYAETEDCEQILRNVLAEFNWNKENYVPRKIYCIDCGMTVTAKKICSIFCKKNNIIEFCSKEEFKNLLLADELL